GAMRFTCVFFSPIQSAQICVICGSPCPSRIFPCLAPPPFKNDLMKKPSVSDSPASVRGRSQPRPAAVTPAPRAPSGNGAARPPYRDPKLPAEKRVADLLARMSLEEKAAQMMCVWQKKAETLLDANGDFDLAKAKKSFAHGHGIGQVG